jgi:hypothetical protein
VKAISKTSGVIGFQHSSLNPKEEREIKAACRLQEQKKKRSAKKRKLVDPLLEVKDSNDSFGMGRIEWDGVSHSAWGLISSSGAYSALHHDGAGYKTWVKCILGMKLWGYQLDLDPSNDVSCAMQRYQQIIAQAQYPQDLSKFAKSANIILTPGTILYVIDFLIYG